MMTQQEEDAKLGRMTRWFGRWFGASMLICMVCVCIVGEHSEWRNWILSGSLLGGAGLATLLSRANDHEEETRTQRPRD